MSTQSITIVVFVVFFLYLAATGRLANIQKVLSA